MPTDSAKQSSLVKSRRLNSVLITTFSPVWIFVVLPLIVAILVDQWLKNLSPTTIVNENLAWSIPWLFDSPAWRLLAILLIIGGLILIAYHQLSTRWRPVRAVLYGLLIGAALSNWLDRIWFGGVRDIWTLPILQIVNNPADWLLVLSVIGLIGLDFFEAVQISKKTTAI